MAAPIFVADEVVTATKMNSLPKGILGYAEVTASQGSITTEVDLTGLSVTVDVAADRRIRVTGAASFHSSVGDGTIAGNIKESTTKLGSFHESAPSAASRRFRGEGSVVITPSSGSHTYKLSGVRSTGTGTVTMVAASDLPAFILVEDIGGV